MNESEQIVVNRADLKRLHDLRLAEVHKLREMLELPPLMTGKQERLARQRSGREGNHVHHRPR